MRKALLAAMPLLVLSACQTVGGPGGSRYFDCRDGRMLKVTYMRNGAMMQVGNERAVMLDAVPGVDSTYERNGYRLHVVGDTATWNGLTREAPHVCSRVAVPR